MAANRIAGVAGCAGLLAGELGGALMHFPPYYPQQVLREPFAVALLAALAFGTIASMAVWARQSTPDARVPLVTATFVAGFIAVLVNAVFPRLGYWGGMAFEGPLVPLAVLTGLRAMFQIGLILLSYRWLAARRRWLGAVLFAVVLLGLIPGTIRGDERFLASGVLRFGNGYEIWHDVLLGETFFALSLAVYEAQRWRIQRSGSRA